MDISGILIALDAEILKARIDLQTLEKVRTILDPEPKVKPAKRNMSQESRDRISKAQRLRREREYAEAADEYAEVVGATN